MGSDKLDGRALNSTKMNKHAISKLGWWVFGLLILGLIAAKEPYKFWFGRGVVFWIACCVGFTSSFESKKPLSELVKTAALTCLCIGCVSFLLHGSESRDEYGDIVSRGFETTFDGRAGAAVRVFAMLFLDHWLGS